MKTLLMLILVLVALAAPGTASAAEGRTGADAVVPANETINDDFFAAAEAVTVAGRVTGDVFAVGQTIVVTGTIDGDLIAVGQQVVVDGNVGGDVRAGGAVVTVNGQVGKNVTGVGQRVQISPNGRVGGSVVAVGSTVSTAGTVARGVTAGGQNVQLSGQVGGNVSAVAETLTVAPTARIAGNLSYGSEREGQVPQGTVAGKVTFTETEREERREPFLNGLLSFGSLVFLIGTGILGALAVTLAPKTATRVMEYGRAQPLQAFGWGLVILFGVPVAAILIGVTLVGIPLAVVVGALYFLAVLLAKPAVALVVGAELARWGRREPLPLIGALVVGLIALHLLTHVPVLDVLVGISSLALGLGLIFQIVRRWRQTPAPAENAVA